MGLHDQRIVLRADARRPGLDPEAAERHLPVGLDLVGELLSAQRQRAAVICPMANPKDFTWPRGHPRRKVRDFARKHCGWKCFSRGTVLEFFGDDITTALMRHKIIKRKRDDEDNEYPELFAITEHGNRMAAVKFTPRINRAKADAIIAELLVRVREINADPDLLCYVNQLVLFGSYARGEDDLGDIDILYDLDENKYKLKSKDWWEANLRRVALAGREERYDDRWSFGKQEVIRKLTNRSLYIALCSLTRGYKITGPRTVLYERPGFTPRDIHGRKIKDVSTVEGAS